MYDHFGILCIKELIHSVKKAIIHRRKTVDCLTLLEAFLKKQKTLFTLYTQLIIDYFFNFITICFYISCFFIYHLSSIWSYSKIIHLRTSLNLMHILPYYFSLLDYNSLYFSTNIYYFYLTKINLFIFIPYSNQVYDNQRKNISQWCFVCVV